MSDAKEDLPLALQLADVADRIAMGRHRAADLQVWVKSDQTPVTEADRAVEVALREELGRHRPQEIVLGEEYGEGDGPAEETRAPARRWIIDPIDGTKSYVRGMPTWATLIALEEEGEPLVGVVSMPALGKRWWATRGGGAFANGSRIHVSDIGDLESAQMCWSGVQEWDDVGRLESLVALARACARSRGIGDVWQYMLVAEGAAEIAIDPEASLWDLAAPRIVVQEAGGTFTDLHGRATAGGGSGIATNGRVHSQALELVGL